MSLSRDGTVRFWRINPPIRVFHSPGAVYHVAFSPSSEQIAADGDDFIVRVWDRAGVEQELVGHSGIVFGVAFVDEQHVVSTAVDGSVRWWELPAGSAAAWNGEHSRPEVLALAPDRHHAAIGYHNGGLHVFDTRTHREALKAKLNGAILAAAWSPRGDLLAVGGDSHNVTIWNVEGERREIEIGGQVTALVFSPGGERVTAGSSDGCLTTVTLSGTHISRVCSHSKSIAALRYAPDGSLVSAGEDGAVRIDRAGRSELVLQFDDRIRSLAISPDALVAAASNDHTVRVRDLRTGALSVLRGDKRAIRSVEFSPEGTLAYGSEDGNVRIIRRSDLPWTPRGREALRQWLGQETSFHELTQR
jgi:WD40 repeat protein